MSNAASEGQKRRWAKIPPAKRSEIMAPVQKAKWAKMSKAQRKAHSKLMTEARLKKIYGREKDKNDGFRTGQEQTNDELDQMFKEMTDPEEIERARLKKLREENVEEQTEDNGF